MNYFKRISVDEADVILSQDPQALLLDVRDERAYEVGHHPRAKLLNDFELKQLIKHRDKSRALLIYCYHGLNSREVAKMFADFGYKHCYSIEGGYSAWRQPGPEFPVSDTLQQWMEACGFDSGAVNARLDSDNRTALMLAAKAGRADLVQALVEAGANPNCCDSFGNNALWYACLGQNLACVKCLINADVETDNENCFGFTALNYSVGLDDIVNFLKNLFGQPELSINA